MTFNFNGGVDQREGRAPFDRYSIRGFQHSALYPAALRPVALTLRIECPAGTLILRGRLSSAFTEWLHLLSNQSCPLLRPAHRTPHTRYRRQVHPRQVKTAGFYPALCWIR